MIPLMIALVLNSEVVENAAWAEVRAEMAVARGYWIAVGVLEEEESKLTWPLFYEDDLRTLQWRLDHTPPDAPHPSVGLCLPTAETCSRMQTLNLYYRGHLRLCREWALEGPERDEIDAVMADADRRYTIWHLTWKVTGKSYYGAEGRRYDLHRLREMIGPDAFDRGEWPLPLPPAAYRSPWSIVTRW